MSRKLNQKHLNHLRMKKTFLFYVAVWLIPCLGQTQSPATPSPPDQINQEKIYKYWDVPPVFAGCEELQENNKIFQCSYQKTLQFLKDNIKYPASFVKDSLLCSADAKYVVEIDGRISNIELIKERGEGTGDELLRLLRIMPPMRPGILDSMPVRCMQWVSFQIEPDGEVSYPSSEIFKVVEVQPVFPGCETIKDSGQRSKCSTDKAIEYINKHVAYPTLAVEDKVEGKVVVKFIVEKDGSVTGAGVVKTPGAVLGDKVLNVVREMPDWKPGKQRGRPVRVQVMLSIEFL